MTGVDPTWLVVADDRTGALEVAGELATFLGPVPVRVAGGPAGPSRATVVTDSGSRHHEPGTAALRAVAALAGPAQRRALKMDSTLRGNWAAEAVAARRAGWGRVLVIPALPRVGRACTGGVVTVGGTPVGSGDARADTWSPRPVDHLSRAGAGTVDVLADAAAVEKWVRTGSAFAVADASTERDLAAVAAAVASDQSVLVVGSAAAVAATIRAAVSATDLVAPADPTRSTPIVASPVVVACGSLHAGARAQLERLRAAIPAVEILASGLPDHVRVEPERAEAVAAELARRVHRRLEAGDVATLVILGGDTAAAVLGDEPVMARGVVAPGTPWGRSARWPATTLVTRAGGFGPPDALVQLVCADRGRTGMMMP